MQVLLYGAARSLRRINSGAYVDVFHARQNLWFQEEYPVSNMHSHLSVLGKEQSLYSLQCSDPPHWFLYSNPALPFCLVSSSTLPVITSHPFTCIAPTGITQHCAICAAQFRRVAGAKHGLEKSHLEVRRKLAPLMTYAHK